MPGTSQPIDTRLPAPGVACPGCPHRAAYVACKSVLGRGRGRVICGDVGCPDAGPMHPAAAICAGGEQALLDRYKTPVPSGGTIETPACDTCIHFIPGSSFEHAWSKDAIAAAAAEGTSTVLAILASSSAHLTRQAIEALAAQALEGGCRSAVVLDPFDTSKCEQILGTLIAQQGLHAVIFASPCARLQHGTYEAEPVEIDAYACMGCHRCQQITGCPAIVFDPPVFRIDASSCAGCDLCVEHCRTKVIYSPRSRMTPEERSRARYAAARQR